MFVIAALPICMQLLERMATHWFEFFKSSLFNPIKSGNGS